MSEDQAQPVKPKPKQPSMLQWITFFILVAGGLTIYHYFKNQSDQTSDQPQVAQTSNEPQIDRTPDLSQNNQAAQQQEGTNSVQASWREDILKYQQSRRPVLNDIRAALDLMSRIEADNRNLSGSADCIRSGADWKDADDLVAKYLRNGDEEDAAYQANVSWGVLNNVRGTCFANARSECMSLYPDSPMISVCHSQLQ